MAAQPGHRVGVRSHAYNGGDAWSSVSAIHGPPFPEGYLDADDSAGLISAAIVIIVFNTVFLVLRFLSRWIKREATWGWDDILIPPAYVLNMALCSLGLVAAERNLGRHTDALLYLYGPPGVESVLKTVWVLGWIWFPAEALPKLSILCLYLRVFSVGRIRVACYIMIGFVTANAIACVIANAVICHPITAFWDLSIQGHCFNYAAFFVACNVPHVFADLCIMLIPLPVLWGLQMIWSKKAGIAAIFLAGSVGIVGSCYRLYVFASGKDAPQGDIVWGAASGLAWSIIEPGMCFIAACLLALKPLFERALRIKPIRRMWRKFQSGTGMHSTGQTKSDVQLDALAHSQKYRRYAPQNNEWERLPDDTEQIITSNKATALGKDDVRFQHFSRPVGAQEIRVEREVTVTPHGTV